MKLVRTAALSRHTAPAFVMAAGLELIQLRKLPNLAFRLFIELLAMADHVSGRIDTSYAVLIGLLDFDQAPTAHRLARPTKKSIRTAIEDLVSLRLVSVDRIANEKRQGLFFQVQSRARIASPANKSGRVSGRVAKADVPRKNAKKSPDEGQTEGQVVQEKDHSPLPPLLSTAPPAAVAAKLAELRATMAARAGGR